MPSFSNRKTCPELVYQKKVHIPDFVDPQLAPLDLHVPIAKRREDSVRGLC